MKILEDKPFRTVDQQIEILRSRNMGFGDIDDAKRFLLRENYYAVINGYKDLFLQKKVSPGDEDHYRDGTMFEEIQAIYLFDGALRDLCFKYILAAENHLKTALVYAFCELRGGGDSYLDPANYCASRDYKPKGRYTRDLIRLLSTLQAVNDNKMGKDYIRHYRDQHGCVPLWVASRCLTFGNMSAFYNLQRNDVQNATCRYISDSCEIANITNKQLKDVYRTLVPFRNTCAHGERLYCARAGVRGDKRFADMILAIARVSGDESARHLISSIESVAKILSGIPGLDKLIEPYIELDRAREAMDRDAPLQA